MLPRCFRYIIFFSWGTIKTFGSDYDDDLTFFLSRIGAVAWVGCACLVVAFPRLRGFSIVFVRYYAASHVGYVAMSDREGTTAIHVIFWVLLHEVFCHACLCVKYSCLLVANLM